MKPEDRYRWIEEYMHLQAKRLGEIKYVRVNILDAYFVNDYIEATGADCVGMPFGADKCKQLGRDLARMFHTGRLLRHADGLWNMAGMGFPRWVYTYQLPH